MPRKEDHEIQKRHVVALGKKIIESLRGLLSISKKLLTFTSNSIL